VLVGFGTFLAHIRLVDELEERVRERTEEFRKSEQGFRLLVERAESQRGALEQEYAIFMPDPAGRVISWNAGGERIQWTSGGGNCDPLLLPVLSARRFGAWQA